MDGLETSGIHPGFRDSNFEVRFAFAKGGFENGSHEPRAMSCLTVTASWRVRRNREREREMPGRNMSEGGISVASRLPPPRMIDLSFWGVSLTLGARPEDGRCRCRCRCRCRWQAAPSWGKAWPAQANERCLTRGGGGQGGTDRCAYVSAVETVPGRSPKRKATDHSRSA